MVEAQVDVDDIQVRSVTVTKSLTIHIGFTQMGWATFYIDDAHGTLSIESDWGVYSHRWGRGSWLGVDPPDLSRALLRFGNDYLATKLFHGDPCIYDGQATERVWRKTVLEARRRGELDRAEARGLWSDLDDIDFHNEEGLLYQVHSSCYGSVKVL